MASSVALDGQLAASAGLHSCISLVSLPQATAALEPPSSSSSSPPQLQHQRSITASETITQFKNLGDLLLRRKGHARVRLGPRIATTAPTDSINPNSPPVINPSGNPNSAPINPTLHLGNPNISQINPYSPPSYPNFPLCASETFQSSQIQLPAIQATAFRSFDDCNSCAFDDEGQSLRGCSHIDLNYHNDSIDYHYEGSPKNTFYITEANKGRDNFCSVITHYYEDKHDNNDINPIINGNNTSSFDLNEQPSFSDSPLEKNNCIPRNRLSTKQTHPQERFCLDAHTKATAAIILAPSVSSTPSMTISDHDGLSEFTNPNPQSLTLYESHDQGSLSRQMAQIPCTNPNFEAQLEKAACLINPTPAHSCITLEGNALLPANGSLPRVQPHPRPYFHNSSSSKCHCLKGRKYKIKSIRRVPAISDKIAEIPIDDYSWRKYGQKPIKGSPYPRGYYRCSGVKGCPAKKHVERALDDPTMLIVTYEGDHIHSKPGLEEKLPT